MYGTYRSYKIYKSQSVPNHGAASSNRIWLWASAGLIACFLMTKYSEPIGRLIPKIEIGVYSWRMMTLTSFVAAMLAGALFEVWGAALRRKGLNDRALPREGGAPNSLLLAASLASLIGALAMSAWYVAWPMWRAQSFEPNPAHYNVATLPRGVPREITQPEGSDGAVRARLVSGNGRVTIERWAPELRELRVEMGKPDQLQFRTSNFMGWTATLDGRSVEIKEDAFKNVVVDLPAGDHRVALEFRSTPIRRAGNYVTVLSLALLFLIIGAAIRFKAA